jgi:hypothetical protein
MIEVGNPSLILVAELSRAIDTAHPETDGRQIVDASVVARTYWSAAPLEQPYGEWKSSGWDSGTPYGSASYS